MQVEWVRYLPIATTCLAVLLCASLLKRMRTRGATLHLRWWAFGMFTYGIGTALESWISLFGNSSWANTSWYVAGAILGGYPLAQGSVHLLLSVRTARRLTRVSVPCVLVIAVLVVASPTDPASLDPWRPSGAALGWPWVRLLTPFVNLYAVVFLVGGAGFSAWRYASSRQPGGGRRALGNACIAVGGVLPGVGGAFARSGRVEVLYVAEWIGLVLIGAGFFLCTLGSALDAERSPARNEEPS